MYKVIGSDGKEYGPISLDQFKEWLAQGRLNARTRVLASDATEWKTAAEIPELGLNIPPAIPGGQAGGPPALPGEQSKGLAVTSFILGLVSVLTCVFGPILGLPAIICGHIASSRARRAPGQYGGAGLATAGFILGYCSLLICLAAFGIYGSTRSAFGTARDRAQAIHCSNNMKQIGLAFRVWALDNNEQFPFNVSTNSGGTLEFCLRDAQGLDQNAATHLQILSNELSTTKILICPSHLARPTAPNFANLQSLNVSYQIYSGTNVTDKNPQQPLAICPVHGHILYSDGSVQQKGRSRR